MREQNQQLGKPWPRRPMTPRGHRGAGGSAAERVFALQRVAGNRVVLQLLTQPERDGLLERLNTVPWLTHGRPSPTQLDAMQRFSLADLEALEPLPQVRQGGWGALAALGAIPARRPVAEICELARSTRSGALPSIEAIVNDLTSIDALQRFSLADVTALYALPQVKEGRWGALAALGAIPARRPVAEICEMARSTWSGATPGISTIVDVLTNLDALRRFSLADVTALFTLPQVTVGGWAAVAALEAIPGERSVGDIGLLARSELEAGLPSISTIITLLTKFTAAEIVSIVTSEQNNGSFRSNWDDLVHLAGIDDTAANLVARAQAADLRRHPWLENQIRHLALNNHVTAKVDRMGRLDKQRSCWSWATQGFEPPAGYGEQLIYDYFTWRTNYPPLFDGEVEEPARPDGPPVSHEVALTRAADGDAVKYAWLSGQERLRALADDFNRGAASGGLPGHRTAAGATLSHDVQRALMEETLRASGFDVLPHGTPARWHIGMHEVRPHLTKPDRHGKRDFVISIGWEHWWVEMHSGGSSVAFFETFPFRDPTVLTVRNGASAPGDGGGEFLQFSAHHRNGGDPTTDFIHRVPVRDLLPAQKAIIKNAVAASGRSFTDDMAP